MRPIPHSSDIPVTKPIEKLEDIPDDSKDNERNQELTTEEVKELHCVSQQEVMEEEVTAKEQSAGAVREMLKARETAASYMGSGYACNKFIF
ncbi:hypothetical protein AVEN_28706-1 [Araneus ventricosus]|uniref:Uncharacterized protein n=1 Tax=Araneus ventricosus TaxID=182803 RepID=A0A4Y2J551_ARAVE|nr:hypothetical protein AVEN_28706-1 [Araneus ventricosus]